MVEKKPTFRYLTQDAESGRLPDIREPLGLPIPSLEERARLFLRAIHGESDFRSSDHSEARNTILNAMAADIAAKSNIGLPEEPSVKPVAPIVKSPYRPAPNVAKSTTRFEEDQPTYPDIEDAQISSTFEDRPAPLRAAARREHSVQMSRAPLEVALSPPAPRAYASMATRERVPGARLGESLPPFPAPTRKPARRRLFIWGAALSTFAGLCVLGGLAFYQTATRSVAVTEQSTRGGVPAAGPPDSTIYGANSRGPAADAQLSSRSFLSRDRPAPKYLDRARTVIAAGDIEAVRIALNRMIESGNASAAVDLGSTYDPNILDALGVRNLPADVAKARVWYQRAQQMGSPDAAGLLESLERSERPSP
jgi:hypothetical protein